MTNRSEFPLFVDTLTSVEDWTFNGQPTRELTHCYHDYPARMIPQIASKLLDLYGGNAVLMFDPYCGTGTSLVEGFIRGINVIGTDLNPLARLIASSKTTIQDDKSLVNELSKFKKYLSINDGTERKELYHPSGVKNIDFWFKEDVIIKLLTIKEYIEQIQDINIQQFFKVAFSETVRESSNTRIGEFKLFRKNHSELEVFNPDVFSIMLKKLYRNLSGYRSLYSLVSSKSSLPFAKVFDFNSVNGISEDTIASNSVDIVVTSPPYGDSHTTVAYGQYSRLSLAWLGFRNPEKVDKTLMGGSVPNIIQATSSKIIDIAINEIRKNDIKRGKEVFAFYYDLERSIKNVSKTTKLGGYACYVVGNRTVKGIVLPTDIAVKDFFEHYGFEHVRTFSRRIPNKRMPSRNSPSNIPGILENTMTGEFIVVMRKIG